MKRTERGEILIGFIFVAMIILLLVWGIIDITRYTMLKSSVQGAVVDASTFAKSQDALLSDTFNPANPEMPKYLLARQALSRVFETNPVAQTNLAQITRLPVVEYGTQSGPAVEIDKPEYVAYLPPGTSARVGFADGTTRWVHHTVCCDPTVADCPETARRTNPTNPCFSKSFKELIALYPTEFVTASSFKNTQIFNSNVVTRTAGFPRVQVAAAPVIVVTSTTIPPIIITSTTIPPRCTVPTTTGPACAYDRTQDKISVYSYTVDSETCVVTQHVDREITRPNEHCDPTRGIITYNFNEELCRFDESIKTEVPRITEARRCTEGERTLTLRTQVINPATCQLQINEEVRTRGAANCVESEGALWHESYEKNLLTCDWDHSARRKVQDKPALFCGNDPATGQYIVRNYVPDYSVCNYAVDTTPVPRREVECTIDTTTGEGRETRFTFSSDACQFVALPSLSRPRPANECVETEVGVQATHTQHNEFVRSGDGCAWGTTIRSVTAPPKSCVERLNTTSGKNEAVKTDYLIVTGRGSCGYIPRSAAFPKPDNTACVAEGTQSYRKTYIFNSDPNSCDYTEQKELCPPADCEVSDWEEVGRRGCGFPYRMIRRITQAPQNGGRACPNLEETRTDPCPVDCLVSDWSVPANPACGQDYTVTRTVLREPAHGGQACPPLSEVRHGPSCNKQCVWVSSWANCSGIYCTTANGWGQDLIDRSRRARVEEARDVPGCFAQKFGPMCAGHTGSGSTSIYGGCRGSTQVSIGGGWQGFNIGASGPQDLANFIGVPVEALRNVNGVNVTELTSDWTRFNNLDLTWMMDENCQYVANTENTKVCGFAGTSWSPISLVFDDTASLNEGMTVVPFSIDPKQPEAFSVWKASDKAPLLVYDPADTGKVSSARQLFGNYAFGGKTAQPANYQVDQVREPWLDGYEALALLDTDKDGVVSGNELVGLKLWSDKNRNGVVDDAEMKSLKEEGVTKLFYQSAKNISGSQDKEVTVGYERTVNEKVVTGRSVDWFSKTFTSRQEAQEALRIEMSRQQVAATIEDSLKPSIQKYILPVELSGNPGKFTPHITTDHENDLSGFWLWTTVDKDGKEHPGIFALEQNGERVYGWDVVENVLDKNDGKYHSAIALYPVEGSIKRNSDGTKTFEFNVYDVKGEGKAVNTASLTMNGSVLKGTTSQSFALEKDGKNLSATVNYEWVGRKFIANKQQ